MQNPYGAVPQALENSRLALRDIMADHLATKQMAANLDLAVKKAETENAMVGANLERQRMGQELDLAKMAQSQQQWQQGQENWGKSFGLQQDKFKQDVLESNQRMNLAKQSAARQARAEAKAFEETAPRKARDIAKMEHPDMSDPEIDEMMNLVGIDPNKITNVATMRKFSGFSTPVKRIMLQRKFKELDTKYQAEKDPILKKQYADQMEQVSQRSKMIDYFHTKDISPKDLIPVFKAEEQSGSLEPGTDFNDFYDKFKLKQQQSKETIEMLNRLGSMNGQSSPSPTQPGGRRPLSAFGGTPQKAKIVPRPTKSAETQNSPIGILGY
jgi:nicotinic acid mononucleotide adenylyltransferase